MQKLKVKIPHMNRGNFLYILAKLDPKTIANKLDTAKLLVTTANALNLSDK